MPVRVSVRSRKVFGVPVWVWLEKQRKVGCEGAGAGSVHEEYLGSTIAVGAAHKEEACGCAVRLLSNIST